jgi:hypothetical protein
LTRGVEEVVVNGGEAARRLIAAARGDRIEEAGMPSITEQVREGAAPSRVLVRLAAIGEHESRAADLLRGWAAEDAEATMTGPPAPPAPAL